MSTEFKYTREWTDEGAFPLLGFTKNWENPSDYPTYEPDEMQVRKDMQSLHDEVKDFLNNELIPRVVLEDATVDAWTASEDTRVANEAERVAQEQARASAEQARVAVEASRVTTESARVNAESARATAEQGRASAEDTRAASEAGRVSAESSRVTAESARATVEAGRVTAESGRVDAENTRVANENTRISTEQGRKDAEAVRVANENQRIENNNTLVQTTQEAREAIDSVEKLDADWVELPAGSPVYVEKSVNAEGGIQLTFGLSRGTSGVYVGSGTMPDDANIQIDPTGDPTNTGGFMVAKTYDPTGKATDVYKYADDKVSAHGSSTSAHSDIRTAVSTAQSTADGKANAVHTHDVSDINSGTLPIARGGTGVTSHTDTTYTAARYRASALVSADTNPTVNGVINWTYK